MSQTTPTIEELRRKTYLTIGDLCVWFSCGRTTFYRMRVDSAVPFPKPVKTHRAAHPKWKREAIEAYERKLEQRR